MRSLQARARKLSHERFVDKFIMLQENFQLFGALEPSLQLHLRTLLKQSTVSHDTSQHSFSGVCCASFASFRKTFQLLLLHRTQERGGYDLIFGGSARAQ
eukprot:SAG11_NODE_247_length_11679_cov_6.170898_5_plen_100_part_00